jgi:glycosyltransferase involved in cell wall biosynthesis
MAVVLSFSTKIIMKSILLLRASSTDFGGIEGQICRIAGELYKRNIFKPILVTSDNSTQLAEQFQVMGFQTYAFPMNQFNIKRTAENIEHILVRNDICLIQSHMFRESLIGRLVRSKHHTIPHVFRAQTYIDCSWIPQWKKFAYHCLDKITSKYVDKYIANGEYLAKEIMDHSWITKEKIKVVVNGRASIGLPDQEKTDLNVLPRRIAMLSNFIEHKGYDVLIKSLFILKQNGLVINVRLIGGEKTAKGGLQDTFFTDRLKTEASKLGVLGQIEFYGFTKDIFSALNGIPVVVLPSDSEGIPNCLLEALSLRKLVVASNVGGIPEIISHGINGLLHPTQSPQHFAAILEKIFSTPANAWDSMRNNGYKTWHDKFYIDTMIDGLISVYRELNVIR